MTACATRPSERTATVTPPTTVSVLTPAHVATTMPVRDILAEHDVARRRHLAAENASSERFNEVLSQLRSIRASTSNGEPVSIETLTRLEKETQGLSRALASDQKSIGAALTKLGRSIDSNTSRELSTLCAPSVLLPKAAIDQSVCDHLFREGLFTLGEIFAEEAGVTIDQEKVEPFRRLHVMLSAFREGDLQPAISWARETSLQSGDSHLEIRLHRLAYLRLLQDGNRTAALEYARREFSRFPEHVATLGKLMACMLYSADLEHSPYSELVNDAQKDDVERALTREYCKSLDVGSESELVTIVRCGAKAIPSLLKASRVAPNWRDLGGDDSLPVEVDVGKDCYFHSIFTCPVSRGEANEPGNGPMLLPCGHVLGRQSILRLPKGHQRFKCPYCPREQKETDCEELYF